MAHLATMKIDPSVLSALGQAINLGVKTALDEKRPPNGQPQHPQHTFKDVGVPPCARVAETPFNDEEWGCHVCGAINGIHRPACRLCGHERCDVVVPPPPSPKAHWRQDDPLVEYETMLKIWPANTIHIAVKRMTAVPAQYMITSHPSSASALYEELKRIHAQREETTYEIVFLDAATNVWHGKGCITMPDARPLDQRTNEQSAQ
jgi:hypothetical protein